MPYRPWYAYLFFALVLLLGLAVVDDYGISWDESIQRRHGRVSIDYAAEQLGLDHTPLEPEWDLETYQWRNYGMVYSITANLLEQALGWEADEYRHYRLRHWLTYLLFWIAAIYFFRTLRLRFPDRPWWALLGTLALVLTPRILGHAFFNPKDHILLVFYVINVFTLLRLLNDRSWRNLILHGIATGLALNTRLPALVIPLATIALLLFEAVRERQRLGRPLALVAVYVPVAIATLIAFLPYLWEDTFTRLAGAFSEMSAFDWDSTVLLFGDRLSAMDLPAYYIPAWMLITTPLLYLLLIFTGLYAVGRALLASLRQARLWRTPEELLDFAQLGLSVGPILIVIVLESTLYNGWRHLHFVFPGFVYLLLVGYAHARAHWGRPKWADALLGLALVTTAVQVVRYHPHQYVYFNEAIHGGQRIERFDVDYWGVSFREALLETAAAIPDGEVRRLKCENWPCKANYYALPPAAKAKFELEGAWHKADLLGTNFLWSNNRHDRRDRKHHFACPVTEVIRAGHVVTGIYDLHCGEE